MFVQRNTAQQHCSFAGDTGTQQTNRSRRGARETDLGIPQATALPASESSRHPARRAFKFPFPHVAAARTRRTTTTTTRPAGRPAGQTPPCPGHGRPRRPHHQLWPDGQHHLFRPSPSNPAANANQTTRRRLSANRPIPLWTVDPSPAAALRPHRHQQSKPGRGGPTRQPPRAGATPARDRVGAPSFDR